ncbi:MAG: hypothetical protein IJX77_04935 [Ruminococcus sp.]|nr:hypothetical protein [Ruminococcus sp.]
MKRSVYSLVLMDDVIKAVDEQAYKLGTSRSNLINQILAERLNCITPEMRMREVFDSITNMLNTDFQIQQQRSDSLMTLRTALQYKYRPTISYKVELKRSPDDYIGALRVQIRTQSTPLLSLFNNFFVYWIELEQRALKLYNCTSYSCELSSGCFIRNLINTQGLSHGETGETIYSYIALLDKTLKLYFSAPQAFASSAPEIEYEYLSRLEHTII